MFLLVCSKRVLNVNKQRGCMLKMLRYYLKWTWQEQTEREGLNPGGHGGKMVVVMPMP